MDFLKECQEEYKNCVSEVWKFDKKKQDQLHDLEFANNYKNVARLLQGSMKSALKEGCIKTVQR